MIPNFYFLKMSEQLAQGISALSCSNNEPNPDNVNQPAANNDNGEFEAEEPEFDIAQFEAENAIYLQHQREADELRQGQGREWQLIQPFPEQVVEGQRQKEKDSADQVVRFLKHSNPRIKIKINLLLNV